MAKRKRYLVVRDAAGRRLCIVRPSDPQAVLRFADEAMKAGEADLSASLDVCEHRLIGFLGRRGRLHAVCDEDGYKIGPLEAGDSFVTERD